MSTPRPEANSEYFDNGLPRMHQLIRGAFTTLFAIDLIWVAYLVSRYLLTNRFMGGHGWVYGYGLLLVTLPFLLLFLIYELLVIRRVKVATEANQARRSRHLATAVFIANVVFVIHQRLHFGV